MRDAETNNQQPDAAVLEQQQGNLEINIADQGVPPHTPPPAPLIDAFFSIPVNLELVLASVKMPVAKLLDIQAGTEVDLSHPAGTEVALVVNGSKIAFGHLFLIDPNTRNVGVRISRLASTVDA